MKVIDRLNNMFIVSHDNENILANSLVEVEDCIGVLVDKTNSIAVFRRYTKCTVCESPTDMVHNKICSGCWNVRSHFHNLDKSTVKKILKWVNSYAF